MTVYSIVRSVTVKKVVYTLAMSTKILLVIFTIGTCVAAVSAQSDTCQACNCQFNNVQVLDQLIENRIAAVLDSGSGKINLNAMQASILDNPIKF